MKLSKSLTLLLGAAAMFAMYGCGSDNRESNIDQQSASYQASAACIGCHDNSNYTSPVTGAIIVEEWKKSAHNLEGGAACTDCHTNSGHPNGGSIVVAVQDTQCGTCHTAASLGAEHFSPFANLTSAQYVSQVDPAGVQCRQCHNPHDTTSLIQYNKDWAESGHGDVAFSNDGDSSNNSVNSHYAWLVRNSCAKCHSTSGYKTVLAGGTPAVTYKKNEAIMCSACHSDYSWARRDPGAQTLEYTYNAAAITLADAGDSNLCLVCHSGRGNGQSARPTRDGSTYHHAVAGAVLFADNTHVGYEFDIDSDGNSAEHYSSAGSHFAHNTIGMTDGSGPCVSCHMKSTKSHTFGVVTKDSNGAITAINTIAVCNTCHTGNYALTPAKLEEESAGYQDAGKLLIAQLTAKGITRADANANNYGAWLNQFLVSDEPGGYAHNRYYVKRLIFDSLDWLDNSTFDGTITIDATAYPEAAAWFRADATTHVATRP